MIEKRDTISGIKLYYYGNEFNLLPGDLLCCKNNKGKDDGHVEFYIGTDKVINWGTVNKEYIVRKKYKPTADGFFSINVLGKEQLFTTIIRFKGD